ncbi:MAG TPA: serine hydrolase, partial [Thermomicrobiales bacterium]
MQRDDATVSALLLGRYRVEGILGEGGLGSVVRAFDQRLRRTVAIKSLKRSLATIEPSQLRAIEDRFSREAIAGSRMGSHPNLVAVYDLVTGPDETLYLILEYVSGGTLAERIRADGALPLTDILRLTADMARGLQAAHDVGLVHRDIKPANIFIAADGRAQVGDFGIAQIDDISGRTQTTVGHPGTPLYMSPEQAGTTGYVTPAADQYSLGLVLFEMLTGKTYKRLRKQEVAVLLAEQPPPVAALIERMVALDPDDRYPSMRDVGAAIAAIERTLAMEADTPYRTPPPVGPPSMPTVVDDSPIYVPAAPPSGPPTPPVFTMPPQPVFAPTPQPAYQALPPPARTSRRAFLTGIGGLAAAGVAGGAVFLLRDRGSGGTGAVATSTPAVGGKTPTTGPTIGGAIGTATAPTATALSPTPTRPPATATVARTAAPSPTSPSLPTATTPALLQPTTVGPNKGVQVQRVLTNLPAGSSVYYTDMQSNTSASVDPDHVYPAAALIDLFIMTEALHQVDQNKLKLTDTLPIRQEDIVGGTGVLQNRQGGTTTIKECIDLIASESDNIAANLLINRISMDTINGTIKTLGLPHTALRRHLADTAAQKAGIENETSASDIATFFAQLARGRIYNTTISTALVNAIAQQNKPEWDYLGGGLSPRPQIVHM